MPWLALALAGVLEVVWGFSMKQSHRLHGLGSSLVTPVAMR